MSGAPARVGFIVLAGLMLWAPLRVGPAVGPMQSDQAGQQPSFGAEVRRVRVDVVVIDQDGVFVDDIDERAFRLFEDGVAQEIISVQLVEVGSGRVSPANGSPSPTASVSSSGTAVPGKAGPGDSAASDPRSVRPSADLGAVIYLVDGLGLSSRNQERFAVRWSQELEARSGLVVPHAIYRINRIGQIEEIAPLSADLEALREGVDEIAARADTDLFRGLRILDRNLRRYELLHQFTEALAGRTGRTALVYVSAGISMMRRGSPDLRILAVQEQMHEAANAANVTFYGLDPSLMYELVGTGIDMSRRSGTSARSRAGSGRDEVGNSLRHAATATGGKAFVGWADLGRVIEIIEQDTDRYYLLTYSPARTANDGAYHELRVEVDLPDVEVRSRRGYVDDTVEALAEKRVEGALRLPGTTGSVPLVVETFRRRSPDGGAQFLVRVSAAVAEFVPFRSPDGASIAEVEAHIGAINTAGDVVAHRSRRVSAQLPDAGGAAAKGTPGATSTREYVTHSELLTLRPGDHELKVALFDQHSERLGAVGASLQVPPADEPWLTSSLELMSEGPNDGERRPLIGGVASFGERIVASLDLYDIESPEVIARVVPEAGAERALHVAAGLEPGADGVSRVSMSLPALPVGRYSLEVHVTGTDVDEVVRASLRIEPPA